jgi:hypothetical protein
MTGTPVRVVETKPPDCREHVGTVVTFVRSVDTVSMSGDGVFPAVVNKTACPTSTPPTERTPATAAAPR